MSEDKLRYFYVRDKNNHPITLVGFQQKGDLTLYSTATCNPKDTFNRKNAHNIVNGRMKSTTHQQNVRLCDDYGPEFDILLELMEHRLERVRNAANHTYQHMLTIRKAKQVRLDG